MPERSEREQRQLDIVRREREEREQNAGSNSRDLEKQDHDQSRGERERTDEPNKRLTEQELRDVLIKRERQLMQEMKQRQRDEPERKPDRGTGSGYD